MYKPKVGDIVQLTRGSTPALVVRRCSNHECEILYAQSGHQRIDPDSNVHRWQGGMELETLGKFAYRVGRLGTVDIRTKEYLLQCIEYYIDHCAELYSGENFPSEGKRVNEMAIVEKGNDAMKTLYEWKQAKTVAGEGKEVVVIYGHKLAINSAGQWVMEGKDGQVYTVDKEAVKEVMPYTVDCAYQGNDNRYSFFARQGDFEEGDVVAHPNYRELLHVKKLDTKSKKATTWLHGLKLQGTVVKSGE